MSSTVLLPARLITEDAGARSGLLLPHPYIGIPLCGGLTLIGLGEAGVPGLGEGMFAPSYLCQDVVSEASGDVQQLERQNVGGRLVLALTTMLID